MKKITKKQVLKRVHKKKVEQIRLKRWMKKTRTRDASIEAEKVG